MAISNSAKLIPVIVIVSILIVTIIAAIFAETQIARGKAELIVAKEHKLELIADSVELRINDATKILKVISTDDEVRNVPYADTVSEEFMGIPPDADKEKRLRAADIRVTYPDFETVAFILPNGDIYLIEPYEAQKNLPTLNFAFREWYQGVVSNGDMYIGEAVLSAATGHRIVPIAVAVYSDDSRNALSGILVGALSMNEVDRELRGEEELGTNEFMLIADHKGNIVAGSRDDSSPQDILESALYLQNAQKALNGDVGSNMETVNGVEMFVSYRPIHVGTNVWALVALQPEHDAFLTINTITFQSILTVVLVSVVSSVSGYILYRSFQSNNTLTRRLENVNEDLKKVDKEKEEFSAMITHELKTPLVPVIGYSELLLDGTLGSLNEKQKEVIGVMNKSATSLSRLISDLLDVRKLELDQMKFEMRDASCKEIVEYCINALRPLAQSKGVALSSTINTKASDDLIVKCDSKRITQVLGNLVNNAIKFVVADKGKVQVSVENDQYNGSILFAINDNGIGIPKDKQQNMFRKFYQADTSMTRNAGGTGLGLAICKAIIEAHKGKIWFESEPGVGSTFYFSLPRILQSKAAIEPKEMNSKESLA